MPTDYSSTARALALPVSPLQSPAINHHSRQPPWSRQSSQPAIRILSPQGREKARFRDILIDNAARLQRLQRQLIKSFNKLTLAQRILAIIAIVGLAVLGVLFFVFTEKIFGWLAPRAEKWNNLRGGWLILWVMIFTVAFPPLVGYSSCLTISGFVFGFPNGWFITASATVAGSFCSFVVSRTLLSRFVHRLVKSDTRFAALSLVLKHDGLKLLCMIRLCPLPYSISNGAMATFETVKPLTFTLATAIVTPKLLVHVFIGSRIAVIARSGRKMDASTKAINWASIIGGVIFGVLTGWFIYQKTLTRSRQLEAEEQSNARHANSRGEFSDDPDEQADMATMLRDDQIDFLDPENEYQDNDGSTFGTGDEEQAINLKKQRPLR